MTKKQLFKLHSWAGLLCILPFLLICFTGSLLVFKAELDALLLPKQSVITPTSERMPIDKLVQSVSQQLPNYELGSWEILAGTDEADRIYLIKKGTSEWHKAYLNPETGQVLSEPQGLHHYLTDWLLQLHYTLLLNDIEGFDEHLGTAFTSIFALLLMFLGISGLIIYRRFWARVFTLRWDQRLLIVFSDLHKMVGTLTSPILLVLGLTGGYYNIAIYVHEWQEHQEKPTHHVMTEQLYNEEISISQLIESAPKYIDGFETTYLLFPTEPEQAIMLYGRVPSSNPLLSDYGSIISYSSETGAFLSQYDIREQSFVAVMVDTFRKLHFGNFAGLLSKIIYAVAGFSPILLGFTGLYLWYSRKKKRLKRRINIQVSPEC